MAETGSPRSLPVLLTTEQLAEVLQLAPSTLRSQRWRGQAPGALGVRIGSRTLYRRSDIDAWLEREFAGVGGR